MAERLLPQSRPVVTDEPFRISVVGIARPQGSKSARIVRGRPILTDGFGDNPRKLKEWRHAIAEAARAWLAVHPPRAPFDEPLTFSATFYLPRPPSTPKRIAWPMRKPDLSKLIRAAEDALTGIVYVDDARITRLLVEKRFAIDAPPRVEICVMPVTERIDIS